MSGAVESHDQCVKSLLRLLCMFWCVRALCARFLLDSSTMCGVINLVTTDTEYRDTRAYRKHPGLARIYGRPSGNAPIPCECIQLTLFQNNRHLCKWRRFLHLKSIPENAEQTQIWFLLKYLYPNNRGTEIRSRYWGGNWASGSHYCPCRVFPPWYPGSESYVWIF